MSACKICKQPVIRSVWCGEEVILAPGPRVFVTLEPFAEDPADGVRVFCATNSYVEHHNVCPGASQEPKAAAARRTAPAKGVE
jgi:hypothetical protein